MDMKLSDRFKLEMRGSEPVLSIPSDECIDADDVLRFAEACSYVASVLTASVISSAQSDGSN